MKIAERIVMVLLMSALFSGAGWFYLSTLAKQTDLKAAVARGEYEIVPEDKTNSVGTSTTEDWRVIYPNTVGITIGDVPVVASVADTLPERILGLSETPYLPDNVVKLFVFGKPGNHSIWMKDMNYPLDIIWVAKEGEIVHIEESIATSTYPSGFASPIPAWYVIEANAGFVERNGILAGDKVALPPQ